APGRAFGARLLSGPAPPADAPLLAEGFGVGRVLAKERGAVFVGVGLVDREVRADLVLEAELPAKAFAGAWHCHRPCRQRSRSSCRCSIARWSRRGSRHRAGGGPD